MGRFLGGMGRNLLSTFVYSRKRASWLPGAGDNMPFGNCRYTKGTGTRTYRRFWEIYDFKKWMIDNKETELDLFLKMSGIVEPIQAQNERILRKMNRHKRYYAHIDS